MKRPAPPSVSKSAQPAAAMTPKAMGYNKLIVNTIECVPIIAEIVVVKKTCNHCNNSLKNHLLTTDKCLTSTLVEIVPDTVFQRLPGYCTRWMLCPINIWVFHHNLFSYDTPFTIFSPSLYHLLDSINISWTASTSSFLFGSVLWCLHFFVMRNNVSSDVYIRFPLFDISP